MALPSNWKSLHPAHSEGRSWSCVRTPEPEPPPCADRSMEMVTEGSTTTATDSQRLIAPFHQAFVNPHELLEEGGLQKSQPVEGPLSTPWQQGRGQGEENQLLEPCTQLFGPSLACTSPLFPLPACLQLQEGDGQGTSCLNRAEASVTCRYHCRHSQVERAASVCSGCLCANIKHVLQLTCKECVSLKRICSPGEHKTQLRCLIVSHPPDRNNRRR